MQSLEIDDKLFKLLTPRPLLKREVAKRIDTNPLPMGEGQGEGNSFL